MKSSAARSLFLHNVFFISSYNHQLTVFLERKRLAHCMIGTVLAYHQQCINYLTALYITLQLPTTLSAVAIPACTLAVVEVQNKR
jgi:hypothetical protein